MPIVNASAGETAQSVEERNAKDICWRQRRDIKSFLRRAAAQLSVEEIEAAPAGQPAASQYAEFRTAWERAQDKRIRMVFHGTPAHNAHSIAQHGLDPSRRRGQAMGPGEYFGTDAGTSLEYCRGGNTMLVFAVLMDRSGLTTATGDAAAWGIQQQHARAAAAADPFGAGGDRLAHSVESAQIDSGLTVDEAQRPVGKGVVVVHRSSHQLPLFVVRFHVRTAGQHPRAYRPYPVLRYLTSYHSRLSGINPPPVGPRGDGQGDGPSSTRPEHNAARWAAHTRASLEGVLSC